MDISEEEFKTAARNFYIAYTQKQVFKKGIGVLTKRMAVRALQATETIIFGIPLYSDLITNIPAATFGPNDPTDSGLGYGNLLCASVYYIVANYGPFESENDLIRKLDDYPTEKNAFEILIQQKWPGYQSTYNMRTASFTPTNQTQIQLAVEWTWWYILHSTLRSQSYYGLFKNSGSAPMGRVSVEYKLVNDDIVKLY